jgi:DNA-binding CsgD family transcriptional regulator
MSKWDRMLMQSGVFNDVFAQMLENTPIDDWGYCCFNKKGEYFQIESNPMFFKEFIEKKIFLKIPVSESNLAKYKIYSSRIENDPNMANELRALALKHGYAHLVNIIKSSISKTEVYTFVSKQKDMSNINFVINNQAMLENVIEKIKKRVNPLVNKENSIKLPKNIIDKMIVLNEEAIMQANDCYYEYEQQSLKNIVPSKHTIDSFKGADFDFASLPFEIELNAQFTPREKDAIYLWYNGFNTKEAADILEVSKRTIERHFEKIRKKLNCTSKVQIIKQLLLRYPKTLAS